MDIEIDNSVSNQQQPGDHGWIQTYTGIKFYPLQPKIEDINIIDIAHSLSMQCRFLGHIKQFYSVAQHGVLCSRLVDIPGGVMEYDMLGMPQKQRDIIKMYALLHDASEAYLGDVVRPLKHLPEYKFYRDAEDKLQTMIYKRFNLFETEPQYIKLIDNKLLVTENYRVRNGLHPDNYYSKENGFQPLDIYIHEMTWQEARDNFLDDFCELAPSCGLNVDRSLMPRLSFDPFQDNSANNSG